MTAIHWIAVAVAVAVAAAAGIVGVSGRQRRLRFPHGIPRVLSGNRTEIQREWQDNSLKGRISRYVFRDVFRALRVIEQKEVHIMGAIQDAVDQIAAQLAKSKAEVVATIADLEAKIAAGETPDLTALKAAAQALDDVIPDAPVEPTEPTEPTS